MATKAVILSQKKGDAADILLPHTSADLTGYTHASVQDGESVKDALDYLLKTQTGEGSELDGRVSALEKEIDTVEEAAQAAQTAASAAQTAAEQWSADKPGIVQRVDNLEAQKAPTMHAVAQTTYGVGNASLYGHVKLSDTVNTSGVNSGTAATPKAVADEVKKYLPLAGGKITGKLIILGFEIYTGDTTGGTCFYNNDGEYICLEADSKGTANANDGGVLRLYTKNAVNGNAGAFLIGARKTDLQGTLTATKYLVGKTDGTLTWCGKVIATSTGAEAASMIAVNAEQGAVYTLPEGGTYAYSIQNSATGETATGVAAGGSEIPAADSGIHGFAMKIQ